MYCESCGELIPDDSSFCEFCGSPVKEVADEAVNEQIHIKKEKSVKNVEGFKENGYGSDSKPKAKIRILPIILIAVIALGGYAAVKMLGGDSGIPKISEIPGIILGKEDWKEPERSDFSWYVRASFDEMPAGGRSLVYKEIFGKWKVMAVNHVTEPEETFFSTVVLKEDSIKTEDGMTFNTAVEFTHHYVEFDGEKSRFEGDEGKDLLYANFENEYLSLALGDDRVAEIIFWEYDGKEYGQSHIYSDWDKDGMADLVNVLLFVR